MKTPATNKYGQQEVPNTFFADEDGRTIHPAFKRKRYVIPEREKERWGKKCL